MSAALIVAMIVEGEKKIQGLPESEHHSVARSLDAGSHQVLSGYCIKCPGPSSVFHNAVM